MLQFRGLDEYESEVPTEKNRVRADAELTVVRATPAPPPPTPPTPGRAFYVPSPLPMRELKKAIGLADDEITHGSTPSLPVVREGGPPSSAPTQLHGRTEAADAAPAASLEKEACAGWHFSIPPLPALEDFAPLDLSFMSEAVVARTASTVPPPPKKSRVRAAAAILMSLSLTLIVALVVRDVARGDLTRDDVRGVTSSAQHAVDRVLSATR